MTTPKTPENQKTANHLDSPRLPWSTPRLRLYDASEVTKGSSDQSSDGGLNTHS